MRNEGSSWNSTMFWVRRRWFSAPVKNPARQVLPRQQVADGPVRQIEHPAPLAEDHGLAALVHDDLLHELAELEQLGHRQPADHRLLGRPVADRRPDVLELELRQAVADDPLECQQAHQPEELGLRQRAEHRLLHQDDDRLIERVVLDALLLRHLDRHACVGPRRELVEHVLADAAHHAVPQPVTDRAQVPHADDLVAAVLADRVQRPQPPLRLQRQVVDPLDDRGQLVDPVLHRRAGQHQAVGRRQPLDRQRRLGRPVLDPLRLVEHDQVGIPGPDDLQVAEELLVIDDEEALFSRGVERLPDIGRAVDDLDGQVGEHGPFAGPLGLEAGRRDDQAAADPPALPEDAARRDGLRGLAQAHVVGQEQPALAEEPQHALALIGIERPLQAMQPLADLGGRQRLLNHQAETLPLPQQQGSHGRIVAQARRAGRDDLDQVVDERQPALGVARVGALECRRRRPSVRGTSAGPARRGPIGRRRPRSRRATRHAPASRPGRSAAGSGPTRGPPGPAARPIPAL